MIRCVIFDLDGVIVHTDELHYQSWQRVAREEGIEFDRSINERLRGVDRATSLGIVLERSPRVYSDEERAALMERKNACYVEALRQLGPDDAAPGARALLTDLREAGVSTAVASSSRNARAILERIAMKDFFDTVVDGNDVIAAKPAPDLFLLAATRCAAAPDECVVLEDAKAGIEAARRAGMCVVRIGDSRLLEGADRIAPTLSALTVGDLLDV